MIVKRFLIVMAACGPLVAAAPAAADYHGACPGGVGSGAGVSLTAASGVFTYSGTVNCNGASSISINSLTLTRPDASTASAGPSSCTACNSLSHSGQDPVGTAGNYVVNMSFTVQGGTSGPITKTRTGTWNWNGTTLSFVGGGGGTPSAFEFCDATQPISMTADFANDNSNPMSPALMRWSGRLECHGADELRIYQISVRRQLTNNNTIDPPHPGTQDAACLAGCSVVTGRGSARTDGPGLYTVTFKVTITKAPAAPRSVTIQRDWVSLGVGPVVPQ